MTAFSALLAPPRRPLPLRLTGSLAVLALALGAYAPEADAATRARAKPSSARRVAAVAPPPPVQGMRETAMPAQPAALALKVGEQAVLAIDGRLARVSLSNDAIADITPLRDPAGDSLRLRALTAGRGDLLVWRAGASTPQRHQLDVIAASGPLTLAADGNGAARIEGRSEDLIAHARATRELQKAVPGKTPPVDASTVDVPSTVQVDVRVVEFSRKLLKSAGLNLFSNRAGFSWGVFSPSSRGDVVLGPPVGGAAGIGANDYARATFDGSRSPLANAFDLVFARNGLVGNLSLLEGNGLARVLAEPSLVAMSGQSASFLAGGEIPIPIPQGLGSVAIEYKAFGIGLTVMPTVLANDRIVLKVAPEASDLDYSNALQLNGTLVPAIVTRRTDTTVELGDGESFVIGGLVNSTTTSNVDKLPLLGDLPVIGSFFKNLRYSKDERELLILVTPRLVRPLAAGGERPPLPGADKAHDQVWRSHLAGPLAGDAVPGFSR